MSISWISPNLHQLFVRSIHLWTSAHTHAHTHTHVTNEIVSKRHTRKCRGRPRAHSDQISDCISATIEQKKFRSFKNQSIGSTDLKFVTRLIANFANHFKTDFRSTSGCSLLLSEHICRPRQHTTMQTLGVEFSIYFPGCGKWLLAPIVIARQPKTAPTTGHAKRRSRRSSNGWIHLYLSIGPAKRFIGKLRFQLKPLPVFLLSPYFLKHQSLIHLLQANVCHIDVSALHRISPFFLFFDFSSRPASFSDNEKNILCALGPNKRDSNIRRPRTQTHSRSAVVNPRIRFRNGRPLPFVAEVLDFLVLKRDFAHQKGGAQTH